MNNKFLAILCNLLLPITCYLLPIQAQINRHALVERNNPVNTRMDTLGSLSVGNGDFAFTVDATGLQTYPLYYSNGVCLGTQSTWGWHSFPNTDGFTSEDALKPYDFGHHIKDELYSVPTKIVVPADKYAHDAAEYLRANPHRLHLGCIGFAFGEGSKVEGLRSKGNNLRLEGIKDIRQKLDMWTGIIDSRFTYKGKPYHVQTLCAPDESSVIVNVYDKTHTPIMLRLPYPTGKHVDDACDWSSIEKHSSAILKSSKNEGVISHKLDSTLYYIYVHWEGSASLTQDHKHRFYLTPKEDSISVRFTFSPTLEGINRVKTNSDYIAENNTAWEKFWTSGAAVDFSHCTAPEARELERRVVLSQYLLKVNCSGQTPPQETGLTFNSWFGKFHLEMPLWHQAWMPLWGHPELLESSMSWYRGVVPIAKSIAQRQGFKGIRWMKMTDPSGMEAPSSVGSFLIWQQPHYIYLSDLLRRHYDANHLTLDNYHSTLNHYAELVDSTAEFMADFTSYDAQNKRYILKHYIPAQESLKASETYNSPYELSEWLCTLKMAQQWRKACNKPFRQDWQNIIDSISPLASKDGLYLAAESATDTYSNIKMTSDHPAILGAIAFYPMSRLVNEKIMNNTLDWIFANWNWPTSWGWDFPMAAMASTRLHQPEKAIKALMMPMQKNTYLPNGHNYQDGRLRIYLPGNGGLLSAIALMCAGWDGCTVKNPGFPKNGQWDVRWEGLEKLP